MKKIILLLTLLINCTYANKLQNINGIIVDKTNNIAWQDTKDNTIMLGSQEEANDYCEQLNFKGYSNWILPTKGQYESIIDNTRQDGKMINYAFQHSLTEGYWTSSRTWRSFGKYGYYFLVKSGSFYYENRNYPKFFRCIVELD